MSETQGKIVTVVGGTGFLGAYVVRELADAGFRVRVISRDPTSSQALRVLGNTGQIAVTYGDVARPETVTSQLAGSYGVVNLVGILFEKGRQKFTTLHAHGAEKLAQAARLNKVFSFVHLSALGIDKAAGSEYARTKLLGEQAVRAAFPESTILRPSVIFGPEDDFFNRFARMSVVSLLKPDTWLRALPLVGGGKTKFQPVYVGDVARAVCEAVMKPLPRGKLYELGGPQVMSFRQIIEYTLNVIGRRRVLIPLPFAFARFMATFAELLPTPPLTRDQVQLLKYDNVVSDDALKFFSLNIEPHAVELIVPDYLSMYRGGNPHA